MVYIKKIPSKKEYGCNYHKFCHSEGVELLKFALMKEYSYTFSEEDISKGKHGKPYIKNTPFHFNISHCDGLVVCALSETEVGIDAESIRQVTDRVMKRCYSDSEIAYVNSLKEKDIPFTRLWTLKESYVKLTGTGVATDLKAVSFDLKSAKAFLNTVSFYQLMVGQTHIVSLCEEQNAESILFDAIDSDFDNILVVET